MLPEIVKLHELIDIVITILDARDPYTQEHSFRVAEYSELISENMGSDTDTHQRVHIAAHLHDIGKVGVSDYILNKPGKLAKEEMKEMQSHSRIGYNILKRIPMFQEISRIVLHHHERFDGGGYPKGLSGEAIPFESRIIAVADAFDAMTSDRPYRKGMPPEEAASEIRNLFLALTAAPDGVCNPVRNLSSCTACRTPRRTGFVTPSATFLLALPAGRRAGRGL